MFVVGAPRSGTTLLRRVLSAHPELEIVHELRALDLAAATGWSVRHGGARPPVGPRVDGPTLALGWVLVAALFRRLAAHTGAVVVGDKYPPDAMRLDALDAMAPGCRVVHIVRDGRDVVSSSLRAFVGRSAWRRTLTPPAPAELARSWMVQAETAARVGPRLGPERFLQVHYEALLTAPDETCRAVLAHVGLRPHPALSAALAGIHPGTTWQRTLHPADLAEVMAVPGMAEQLAAFGYPIPEADPPPGSSVDWSSAARRRDVRRPDPAPEAVVALLAEADHPDSLFAAMHARTRTEPAVRAAYGAWMVARGLPAALARSLTLGPPA